MFAAISWLKLASTSLKAATAASVDLSFAGWVKYDSFTVTIFFASSRRLHRADSSTTCSALGSKRSTSTCT